MKKEKFSKSQLEKNTKTNLLRTILTEGIQIQLCV